MKDNWKILGEFLGEKIKTPIYYPSFIIYFIIVILAIGSIGFWAELLVDNIKIEPLTTNAANIFLALIAASSVELILIEDNHKLKSKYRKNDIRILSIGALILGFLLWVLSMKYKSDCVGLIISIVGLLLAYITWWVSNADNDKLVKVSSATAAFGESGIKTNDNGTDDIKGDLSDFKK